jgi:hypothetical protein
MISDGGPVPTHHHPITPLDQPALVGIAQGDNHQFPSYAAIRWDDGRVVTLFTIKTDLGELALYASRAPATPGNHGFTIAFWQVSPAGKVVNSAYATSFVTVDQNSLLGTTINGFARQTFSGKIGDLAGDFPDELDGAQTPATAPTPGGSNGQTTTYKAAIYWGDNTLATLGTLKKNTGTGTWEIWGSHTYTTGGTYKIQYYVATTPPAPATVPALTVSTALITATTHAADRPFYAFAGQPATATLGRVGLSFQPADIDNSSNLAAGVLHYLPPNQTIGKVITVTIYWGDNTSSAAALSVNASGGFDVTGTHTYAKAGGYQISVRAFWTANYSPDDPNTPILIAQPALYHGETAFTQQAWVGPAPVETGAVLTLGGTNTYNGNSIRGSGSIHLNLPANTVPPTITHNPIITTQPIITASPTLPIHIVTAPTPTPPAPVPSAPIVIPTHPFPLPADNDGTLQFPLISIS